MDKYKIQGQQETRSAFLFNILSKVGKEMEARFLPYGVYVLLKGAKTITNKYLLIQMAYKKSYSCRESYLYRDVLGNLGN